MEQKRTDNLICLTAVYLCAAVPVLIYLFCLFLSADSYPALNEYGSSEFLVQTLIYSMAGIGFGWLFRNSGWIGKRLGQLEQEEAEDTDYELYFQDMWQRERRIRRRSVLRAAYLLLAFLILLVIIFIVFGVVEQHVPFALWKVRDTMYCLWPMMLVCLFRIIWDLWELLWNERYIFGMTEAGKTIVYFMLTGFLVWLMQDVMAGYYYDECEPVRTVYLLLSAAVILVICRGRLKSRRNQVGILIALLLAVSGLCWIFFHDHYRVREILYNLGIEAAKGEYFFNNENWLTYHMAALTGNMNGDISMLSSSFLPFFSYTNPLSFMNYVGGGLLTSIVLAWLCLWLIMLFRLGRRMDGPHFYRILIVSFAFSMTLKLLIGIAADALLVASSGVVVPLLGHSPDMMILTAIPHILNLKKERQNDEF